MRSDAGARHPLSLMLCLMTPAVILMMGVIGSLVIALKAKPELTREVGRGLVPQGFEVSLPEAGDYTLWWLSEAEFEGEKYVVASSGETARWPEGAKVMLYRKGESETIDLQFIVSSSRSIGDKNAASLGSFSVNQPMDIEVKSTGLVDPVVVKIAPVKAGELLRVIFTIAVVMVVDVLIAIIVLFVLLHRRRLAIDADAGVHHHATTELPPEED